MNSVSTHRLMVNPERRPHKLRLDGIKHTQPIPLATSTNVTTMNTTRVTRTLAILFAAVGPTLSAAFGQEGGEPGSGPIDISRFDDSIRHWNNIPNRRFAYERYAPGQYREIADNLLRFQNADGGWPKNVDWLAKLDRETVFARLSESEKASTCDNRNTYTQIEYLSKVYERTGQAEYRSGASRGLQFILATQNASGGWRGADVDAITFNDDVMAGVMHLLLDIVEKRDHYAWVDAAQHKRVQQALDRAIDVTLRCQIIVDGVKTAWCQQHDHKTLAPVKARRYELPSITSLESCGVVEVLMRLPKPSPEVVSAIRAAVAWMERSAIHGIRLERRPVAGDDEEFERFDVTAVRDAGAPRVWARYYEIETNRPFFANRDGIKVYSLDEVQQERRIGYAWYGDWPEQIITKAYPKWLEKLNAE